MAGIRDEEINDNVKCIHCKMTFSTFVKSGRMCTVSKTGNHNFGPDFKPPANMLQCPECLYCIGHHAQCSHRDKGMKSAGEIIKQMPEIQKLLTQEAYFKEFELVCAEMLKLGRSKNADYAEVDDAFANFRMIEELTGGFISKEWGLITRITDKLKRICSLMRRSANVKTETIADTAFDLAVYSVILCIMLRRRNEEKNNGNQI